LFTAIKTAISLLAALVALTGCIYTNTVEPYTKIFNETQAGTKSCEINYYKIKEPVTGYNMYAEWTTSYILSEARKAGIKNIYYMDLKTLSILGDTFKRESLIIYGD
jgi:hypothetical protein